jgi:hypothetical protein
MLIFSSDVPLRRPEGILDLDEEFEREARRAASSRQFELAAGNLRSDRQEVLLERLIWK